MENKRKIWVTWLIRVLSFVAFMVVFIVIASIVSTKYVLWATNNHNYDSRKVKIVTPACKNESTFASMTDNFVEGNSNLPVIQNGECLILFPNEEVDVVENGSMLSKIEQHGQIYYVHTANLQ